MSEATPNFAFRAYVEGDSLVFAIFPTVGGDVVAEKRVSLSTLGLEPQSGSYKPPQSIQSGSYLTTVERLERGGIRAELDYENQHIKLIPVTRMGNDLHSQAIAYSFNDLNLKDVGASDCDQDMEYREFRVTRDVDTDY